MEKRLTLNRLSLALKYLVVLTSLGGVTLSLIYAERDGYSHWATRLMYFTGLSNVWIGFTVLFLILVLGIKPLYSERRVRAFYVLRYVFTVSIAITGIVYCFVLAPMASKENFNAWTFSQILTHVVCPVLSVADFLIDNYKFKISKEHLLMCAIPPLVYFIFAGILNILNVDFGRGDPFPYFFLNLKSPAGIFGFSDTPPFVLGSFYWILLFLGIIYSIAVVLMVVNSYIMKKASR